MQQRAVALNLAVADSIRERAWFPIVLAVTWVVLAFLAVRPGVAYYALPLHERPFSPLHERFAPTGRIGHSFGIIGSMMMLVGVCSYSLRKRWSPLQRVGKLKHWLQTHIFLCTFGPFLILLHTAFKFGGLVAIAFWSMSLVVLSGIFGRYVYVRIPKAVNGQFRTLQDVRRQRDEIGAVIAARVSARLQQRIRLETAAPVPAGGSLSALVMSARLEIRARRQTRRLRRRLIQSGVPHHDVAALLSLVREQARIERQLALLGPFHRLFRYWHVFHLPFAIVMFAVLAVHIAVAVAFGYGWPFQP